MGKKTIIIIIIAVVVVALCVCCVGGFILYQTGDDLFGLRPDLPLPLQDEGEETDVQSEPEEDGTEPTAQHQVVNPGDQTWLVMLYEDADDEILERDLSFDVNESESVGSSNRVTIVAQFDRTYGAYEGEGDWTSPRRILLNVDCDLN